MESMLGYEAKVIAIGNSLGILIPKSLRTALKVKKGTVVYVILCPDVPVNAPPFVHEVRGISLNKDGTYRIGKLVTIN